MSQLQDLLRGTVDVVPADQFRNQVDSGRRLRIKFGADPTAPDLHLGHLVVLRKLRQFQDYGHTVVFIIGDFTARVGDPSGRNATRPPLAPEQIEQNARTYLDQVFKVLDRKQTEVVRNGDWLGKLGFDDVLRLASKQTVARMLERDDFTNRIREGQAIGIHELLYPIMQGYDSVVVKSDVEVGGSDQKFNLLVGRDLQQDDGQPPQSILTLPLLVGTDGGKKMSKSYGNYIAFEDKPEDKFGKIMSIPDSALWDYWLLLTGEPAENINERKVACADGKMNPRDAKAELGRRVVEFFDGPAAASAASDHFDALFVKKGAPEDMPEFGVSAGLGLVDVLVGSGAAPSKKEARRLIGQGAVYLDGGRVDDESSFKPASGAVLKVGKRRFIRLKTV